MAPKAKAPKKDINILKTPYNPPSTTIAAPGTLLPPHEIKINPNNLMAKLQGSQSPTSIIRRLQAFFLGCPLYGALTLNPQRMYHDCLCEFWYTTYLTGGDETINFTLKSSTIQCSLDVELFRRALQLNYFTENELPLDLPGPNVNLREVIHQMGHTDAFHQISGFHKSRKLVAIERLGEHWPSSTDYWIIILEGRLKTFFFFKKTF